MYCLRVLIVVMYYSVYHDYFGEQYVYTKDRMLWYYPHLCPIVKYGMRLCIVVLQELPNCLYILLRDVGFYHFPKFH